MSSINETASISPSVAKESPDTKTSSRDLPPSRKSRAIRRVSPPLSKISLNKFIYTLTLIVLVIGAFYSYLQLIQHKRQVGGWWNQLMGKNPIQGDGPVVGGDWAAGEKSCNPSDLTVEDHINALAQALGVTSSDLARAIASAVRQHVPPASLSSIVAKETGEVVRILTDDESVGGKPGQESASGSSAGVFGNDGFVEMDE